MYVIKKRCNRCRQHLRDDGTCQNPKCVKYKPPKEEPKPDESDGKTEDTP